MAPYHRDYLIARRIAGSQDSPPLIGPCLIPGRDARLNAGLSLDVTIKLYRGVCDRHPRLTTVLLVS